jgi:hypothetical protein
VTIAELWQEQTALEIKAGRSAAGRFLLPLQLTKKILHAEEQVRPDVQPVGGLRSPHRLAR